MGGNKCIKISSNKADEIAHEKIWIWPRKKKPKKKETASLQIIIAKQRRKDQLC